MTHTLEFRCPITLEAVSEFDGTQYQLDGTAKRAAEIKRVIKQDSFWSGNQARYICDWDEEGQRVEFALDDVRFDVEYADFQLWGKAYVHSARPLKKSEIAHVVKGITGQFSDGWGESFEQTEIEGEPPYSRYYCKFWSDEPWWRLEQV